MENLKEIEHQHQDEFNILTIVHVVPSIVLDIEDHLIELALSLLASAQATTTRDTCVVMLVILKYCTPCLFILLNECVKCKVLDMLLEFLNAKSKYLRDEFIVDTVLAG